MKTNGLLRANNFNIPMISGIWLVDLVKRYRHNLLIEYLFLIFKQKKILFIYFFCPSLLQFSAYMETPSRGSTDQCHNYLTCHALRYIQNFGLVYVVKLFFFVSTPQILTYARHLRPMSSDITIDFANMLINWNCFSREQYFQ